MEQDRHIGQQIGNYRLVEQLDCGSFGCVYRAEHLILKTRTVAIKILHAHLATQQKCEDFFQEAELLNMLKHPHILPVLDVGIQDGFPYLVSEYCPEGSLYRRLNRQRPHPLPMEEAITILTQVGQALQYVHEQHIVHRDLKPENILFNTKWEALLADFGIAKMLDSIGVQQGTITGTPAYMAPEQFRGIASSEGDQYALGCIAYELVTGQKPFTGSDMGSMMYKHLTEQPVAPRQLNLHLPVHIEQAILTALAKKREARHADVAMFIAALRKSAQQWFEEGYTLRDLKRYQEALAAYKQAIRLDPNYAAAYNGKGYALNGLKRYQEALAAFEQAIRLNPNYANTYNGKGYALGNLKRYQEALAAFEQAIRLDPNYAAAYNGKGYALHDLKRYQEALAAYKQAIHLDPNLALAYNGMGYALGDLKRYQEALAAFEQAIRLDPNLALAYSSKGAALNELKRYEEGLAACEQAIRLDPNLILAYNNKGYALGNLKRYQEALAAFEQAIRLDPNFAPTYNGKGLALTALGKKTEAQQAYEKARQLGYSS